MVPSSSMVISAPVSSWMELIILPLGPMTSPILSTGTLIVMIRGACGLISPGASIASRMTSRMVSRAPVQLGVELERGDDVRGAGDLEVHVAERVLGAQDVGERDVLAALMDQA